MISTHAAYTKLTSLILKDFLLQTFATFRELQVLRQTSKAIHMQACTFRHLLLWYLFLLNTCLYGVVENQVINLTN